MDRSRSVEMPLWHQLAIKSSGRPHRFADGFRRLLSRNTRRVQVVRDCAVQRNPQIGAAQFGRPRKLLAIPPRGRVLLAAPAGGGGGGGGGAPPPPCRAQATGEQPPPPPPPPGRKGSRRLCCVPGARSTICRDCESGCKSGTTSSTTIWRFNSPRDCRPCRRYGRSCRMAATGRLERTT